MFRRLAFLAVLCGLGFSAQASTVSIEPCVSPTATCFHVVNDNSNLDSADLAGITGVTGLQLLYKANEGPEPLEEDGTYAENYETTFIYTVKDPLSEEEPPPVEPTGANIVHDPGEDSISCPDCFLVVKDGNAGNPSQYVFDIGGWDGLMTLALTNFWGGEFITLDIPGSISNVAIWGKVSPIPVPAAFWLFGTALIGFIGFSRRVTV